MQAELVDKPPVSEPAFASVGQEIQFYWSKLPDSAVFLGLAAAWVLLFQFFGWTSAVAGRTDSLFGWMWDKWTDPANDASHGKLIPWVVLGLLWFRRKKLVESVRGVWWPGLIGLGLGVACACGGVRGAAAAAFDGGAVCGRVDVDWVGVGTGNVEGDVFPIFHFCFLPPNGWDVRAGVDAAVAVAGVEGRRFL